MSQKQNRIDVLFKYAGGKSIQAFDIIKLAPKKFNTYFEPFCGACSVLRALREEGFNGHAVVSDISEPLINTLTHIKNCPFELYEEINKFPVRLSKDEFYQIRDTFFGCSKLEQAARFILLAKNSFGGMIFQKQNDKLRTTYNCACRIRNKISKEVLIKFSDALRNTEILLCDFEEIIKRAQKGDFVFLDPPYNARKDELYGGNFDYDEFDRLVRNIKTLSANGVYVAMTNYAEDKVINSFAWKGIYTLKKRLPLVNGRKTTNYCEVMLTNYDEFIKIG